MRLSMIPMAAALVVPMFTPSAKAASPQDPPLQLTLSSGDQTNILNQPLLAQAADPTHPAGLDAEQPAARALSPTGWPRRMRHEQANHTG